jgi:eukaryotic-like serine/threonine-protein kinase
MPLAVGTHLGPYEIVGVLGVGGMGEVYRARDGRLGREVAVKILPESFAGDPEALARFRGEARLLAALNHVNIVGIYDIGTDAGISFVVFELVEGDTLRRRLSGGPLPSSVAINYTRQIADGIGAAHDRGIVHRDLKPENLIITRDERVKILDFGVAKSQAVGKAAAETMAAVTRPGVIIGTMGYMAPEQLRAREIDQRVDLFALGVILYEMLTGTRLFRGNTDIEVAAAILTQSIENPAQTHPGISTRLGALVCRLVEREPGSRVQSARDLNEALADLAGEATGRPQSSLAFAPAAPKATVAVLPFSDMSAQKDQEYLCDGIAEEIISALGRANGLRVVARSSAFQFKGGAHDIREVGRRLGATAVLEGSVRRSGNRIRIGVQLASADGGVQIWSERYDRELEDVLAMQDEIAVNVAEALEARLAPAAANPTPVQTSDLEAYTKYLKARFYWNRRTEADLDQSLHFFREALTRDPGYARAHAGLADALVTLAVYGAKAPGDVVPHARSAAKRALELDPTLASAHACLGCIESLHDWSWASAGREFRRAIALSPDEGAAHQALATNFLVPLGRFDEALSELRLATALDPLSLAVSSTLGVTLFYAGRYDEAEGALLDTLRLDDRFSFAHLFLGQVRAAKGRYDEAIASLEKALQLGGRVPQGLAALGHALAASGAVGAARDVLAELTDLSRRRYASPTAFAQIHIGLGDRAAALEAVRRAAELRAFDLAWLLLRPQFAPLRNEPGFDAVVAAMRLREAEEHEARTRASKGPRSTN